ncbi:uncharacterized protein LOC144197729 isoform X2 [Stigmatopora nigra]
MSEKDILNFDEEDTLETIATPGTNLSKLMITLSEGGTVYYYPPYFRFHHDVLSHHTMSYTGWTTKAGVTMCLRYRFASDLSPHIALTISPSSLTRLMLVSYNGNYYLKTQNSHSKLEMLGLGGQGVKERQWTKLCLVVSKDFVKLQTSCSSAVLLREWPHQGLSAEVVGHWLHDNRERWTGGGMRREKYHQKRQVEQKNGTFFYLI